VFTEGQIGDYLKVTAVQRGHKKTCVVQKLLQSYKLLMLAGHTLQIYQNI
jgi:putative NADH-flavin reductase